MNVDVLAVGGQAAAGLSAETVAWIAAVIGAAGSVIGGFIGGGFALWAARRQAQRDRKDARTDRSHQSALAIAHDIGGLEEAIVAWQHAAQNLAKVGALGTSTAQRMTALAQATGDANRAATEMRVAFNVFPGPPRCRALP
jgi:hypothetical protein